MTAPRNVNEPESLFDLLGRYKKAVLTLATALLTWGTLVVDSPAGAPTGLEWVGLGVAIVGTGTVAAVANKK